MTGSSCYPITMPTLTPKLSAPSGGPKRGRWKFPPVPVGLLQIGHIIGARVGRQRNYQAIAGNHL